MTVVTSLWVYPVKSCKGLSVTEATIDENGFEFDRFWVIVNAKSGEFVSQRTNPALGAVETEFVYRGTSVVGVRLSHKGKKDLTVLTKNSWEKRDERKIDVWGDKMVTVSSGEEAANWINEVLGTSQVYELVQRHPSITRRDVSSSRQVLDKKNIPQKTFTTGFSDGYPFLLIQEESLGKMNSDMSKSKDFKPSAHKPLTMNRFRPNIVVSSEGGTQHDDDDLWLEIQIGASTFFCLKACDRCVMTTINPSSLKRDPATSPINPLAYLNSNRNFGRGALFGQNLVSTTPGSVVRIGDEVKVVSFKSDHHLNYDLTGKNDSFCSATLCAASTVAVGCLYLAVVKFGSKN
eukprot:TRINITY_DN1013_c0_g1_i1.p1 TRINITY_DN1013_c0_g1~~TRINITY_DN1013_c0_g1_i1.p1  ORF type:complete len:348 (+),score=45.40 TRINITY_DN1013_c0_g1_i1:92-1135(+)